MKSMKYLFLACAVFVQSVHCDMPEKVAFGKKYHIERVCPIKVNAHVQSIETMLYNHMLMRCALIGAGATAAAYCFFGPQAPVSAPAAPLTDVAQLQARVSVLEKTMAAVIDAGDTSILNPYNWLFKPFMVAKKILAALVLSNAAIGLKSVYDRFFHKNSVEWYFNTVLHCEDDMKELVEISKILEKQADLTSADRDYLKTQAHIVCARMVSDVEKLAGFVQYKLAQFPEEAVILKQQTQASVQFMIKQTNLFVQDMEHALNGDVSFEGKPYNMLDIEFVYQGQFKLIIKSCANACASVV